MDPEQGIRDKAAEILEEHILGALMRYVNLLFS